MSLEEPTNSDTGENDSNGEEDDGDSGDSSSGSRDHFDSRSDRNENSRVERATGGSGDSSDEGASDLSINLLEEVDEDDPGLQLDNGETAVITTYDEFLFGLVEIGTHSSLVMKDSNGNITLYDPAGGYHQGGVPSGSEGTWVLEDVGSGNPDKTLAGFLNYHKSTGSVRVDITKIKTSELDQSKISDAISKVGDPRGFTCASSVSTVIRDVCDVDSFSPGLLNDRARKYCK
jgi:hypothetical protein